MYGGHFPPFGHAEVVASPPLSFFDAEDREISIRLFDDGPVEDEYEALVELYLDYDPSHRSLGLPPRSESAIRRWQDVLLAGHCVLAWHDDELVGQASLVETGEDECELIVFLHQDYHGAGIGTRLMEALLSHARDQGITRVWLLVERENRPAVNLYTDVGFIVSEDAGPDVEMAVTIDPVPV